MFVLWCAQCEQVCVLALFYSLCLRLSFINNVLPQTERGSYGMTLIEWLMMVLGGLTGNSEWFSDVGADFGKKIKPPLE